MEGSAKIGSLASRTLIKMTQEMSPGRGRRVRRVTQYPRPLGGRPSTPVARPGLVARATKCIALHLALNVPRKPRRRRRRSGRRRPFRGDSVKELRVAIHHAPSGASPAPLPSSRAAKRTRDAPCAKK